MYFHGRQKKWKYRFSWKAFAFELPILQLCIDLTGPRSGRKQLLRCWKCNRAVFSHGVVCVWLQDWFRCSLVSVWISCEKSFSCWLNTLHLWGHSSSCTAPWGSLKYRYRRQDFIWPHTGSHYPRLWEYCHNTRSNRSSSVTFAFSASLLLVLAGIIPQPLPRMMPRTTRLQNYSCYVQMCWGTLFSGGWAVLG